MDNQQIQSLQPKAVVAALLLTAMGFTPMASAELPLRLLSATELGSGPTPTTAVTPLGVYEDCRNGPCVRGNPANSLRDPDPTPFLMELVRETSSGFSYYHTIIGKEGDDFIQEYYIATSNGIWYPGGPTAPPFWVTASSGIMNGGFEATPKPPGFTGIFDSPLDDTPISGSSSGRPDRTVFRQTLKSTGFTQEVLKAELLNKPKITQTVNEAGLNSNFVLDLSPLIYFGAAAQTTGAAMTNTLVVTDPTTNEVLTNFDINTSSQLSNVSAGKYIYTLGNGYSGSNGVYTYDTATYDIAQTRWRNFWDKTANISNGEPAGFWP